ncbi:hypothetical protein B0A55_08014 [Friedmanniomyces simplex]|uniref:Uncharacterized protein n=1 Tax=Friedmanniomyces simplex TaxID=329884 RepID=A0A4U0X2V7_9PEZI|nr:hypothetical protein B0A55_08014 [Friedmanniomyces simplex]
MATSLAELPPELLEMIAAELEETNQLISLRSAKISELEDICNVPRLAAQVKRLEVLCDPEEELARIPTGFHGLAEPDHESFASAVGLALQHCPNLKEIDFTDQKSDAPTKPAKWGPDLLELHFDISATFAAVMSALEAQGRRPVAVRIYTRGTSEVGIVETGRLPYLTSSLTMTEVLAVNVLTHPNLNSTIGPKIGSDLSITLQRCLHLKTLSLGVAYGSQACATFHHIASSVRLSCLEDFTLFYTSCDDHDLSLFLLAHSTTLQRCTFDFLKICESSPTGVADILDLMRTRLRLSKVIVQNLEAMDCIIDFPGTVSDAGEMFCFDTTDEGGWLDVVRERKVLLEGHDEVQQGLPQMQKCLKRRMNRT